MSRLPISVRSGAGPFQTVVNVGAVVTGLLNALAAETRSPSVEATFQGHAAAGFSFLLAFWCALALTATGPEILMQARRQTIVMTAGKLRNRLRREQVGLIGFSGTALAYGAAIFGVQGAHGLGAGLWTVLFGIACWWRVLEAHGDLRRLEDAQVEPHVADVTPLLAEPSRRHPRELEDGGS